MRHDGYAFGHGGQVAVALLFGDLLNPAAHMAWTSLIAAVLWSPPHAAGTATS
ncbi:hypothetical protein ABT275_45505 [Streptomyces sp. NPDC001185]|uniref:hypothetical protein n=1 Tax=Streptomyces sp. NPDC001185 TaxID=3154380 RepID=UPI003320060F